MRPTALLALALLWWTPWAQAKATARSKQVYNKRIRTPVPTSIGGVRTPMRLPGVGRSVYLTAEQVYVDRGTADGLKVGQILKFVRRGKSALCVVDTASEHSASCRGKGIRLGERFFIRPPKPEPPPEPLPPLLSDRELAWQRSVLEGYAWKRVDYDGEATPALGRARAYEVGLEHATFATFSSPGGPFQRQNLHLGLNRVQLGEFITANAQMSVLGWTRRPDDFRFAVREPARLLVYQAEVLARLSHQAIYVGRTWPRFAPGLAMLDGAQAGFKAEDGEWEAGVFGGALPEPLRLVPDFTRWTVGAYAMRRLHFDELLLQPEARLAYLLGGRFGDRVELEGAVRSYWGTQSEFHGQVRLGADHRGPGVDSVRSELWFRPTSNSRARFGARYVLRQDAMGYTSGISQARGLHGDVGVDVALLSWMSLGVQGGVVQDFQSKLTAAWVGPELNAPSLFGPLGGMSVGYQEELGWWLGRSLYAQSALHLPQRVRLLGRLSWDTQRTQLFPGTPNEQELSGYLSLDYPLPYQLSVRTSVLGRVGLTGSGGAAATFNAQLGGRF